MGDATGTGSPALGNSPSTVVAAVGATQAAPVLSNRSNNLDEEASLLKDTSAADLHTALANDRIDLSKRRPWGDESSDDDSDDEDGLAASKSMKKEKRLVLVLCFTLICVFIAIIVVGAWLSANTASASSSQIAGYALLTVGGIISFFFILLCCTVCFASCAGSLSGWSESDFSKEFDPNDVHQRRARPAFIFKQWNDEFKYDVSQHEALLSMTARTLPKEARQELKKARKAKKEGEKKKRADLKQLVVDKLKTELSSPNGDPMTVVRKLRKRVYVIDFYASKGSTVEKLAAQITLILKVATSGYDVIVFRIDSPGGYVSVYGLAAAQIMRLRAARFKTVACIDEVAASGGYMMASVCDEINAAPFAFVGSIGVITYIPNLERVTKETLKVDVYRFTAGKHKRTVDMFGEVTDEDKAKLISELQVIHDEFKDHVKKHRGAKLLKDIDSVATGEGWLAANALEMGLVDRLVTSDQILLELSKEYDILVVAEFKAPSHNPLLDILSSQASGKDGIFAALPEKFMRLFGLRPPMRQPQMEAKDVTQVKYEMA